MLLVRMRYTRLPWLVKYRFVEVGSLRSLRRSSLTRWTPTLRTIAAALVDEWSGRRGWQRPGLVLLHELRLTIRTAIVEILRGHIRTRWRRVRRWWCCVLISRSHWSYRRRASVCAQALAHLLWQRSSALRGQHLS